jgi:hypothetical protein
MNRSKNRMVILVTVIAIFIGMLACSGSDLVSRREGPSPTPTKTPKPTFTETPTPTQTPVPTDTAAPTSTPTPVTPTNTPLVQTATSTPSPEPPTMTPTPEAPTDTPVPPTNTPRPTQRPTSRPRPTNTRPPAPTNTPAPSFPFRQVESRGWPNCGSTGVKVYFKHRNGSVYPGLQFAVYVGGGGCIGVSNRANEADGSTDFLLWPYGPRPGSWEVQVVETSDGSTGEPGCSKITKALSERVPFQTMDQPCDSGTSGVQWVWMTFQEN